jgi:protoporphyrinogen IX oxidase
MVTWFGGLFYLPRLFVYHAMTKDEASIERFKIMERKLYYGIMTPGGVLTTLLGLWLLQLNLTYYVHQGWLHTKLLLVVILWGFHLYCGHLRKQFQQNNNNHSHIFYRWLNEFPVIILVATVVLVVVQPF